MPNLQVLQRNSINWVISVRATDVLLCEILGRKQELVGLVLGLLS